MDLAYTVLRLKVRLGITQFTLPPLSFGFIAEIELMKLARVVCIDAISFLLKYCRINKLASEWRLINSIVAYRQHKFLGN